MTNLHFDKLYGSALQVDTVSHFHSLTAMKNITVSVPDEVYRKARLAAARQDTSVSALVAESLHEIATGRSRHDRRASSIDRAFDAVSSFSASERLTREQVHDRGFMRKLEQRLSRPTPSDKVR